MSPPASWRCSLCGRRLELDPAAFTCDVCGPLGLLDAELDYERIAAAGATRDVPLGVWRYSPLLPLADGCSGLVRQDVGGTPLLESEVLARQAGVRRLAIKDEGRNPSGSLKDRASIVVSAHAVQSGHRRIATSSSGNAAIALAAAVAGTDAAAIAFVPDAIPEGKLAQLLAYGARVVLVAGGYDEAVTTCSQAITRFGWYSRSTAYNPYTTQGKKTVALEIVEQMQGEPIDVVVVPTGDGNILHGVYTGLLDALRLGWIPSLPRLVAVQSSGADAIHHAWVSGLDTPVPRPAHTRADSINVGVPQDGRRALRDVRATGGGVVTVDDDQLPSATRMMGSQAGVFCEPAAAVGWAGVLAARSSGLIGATDSVVLISTGTGMKDPGLSLAGAEGVVRLDPRSGVDLETALQPLE